MIPADDIFPSNIHELHDGSHNENTICPIFLQNQTPTIWCSEMRTQNEMKLFCFFVLFH